jgi:hypothetical protein
MLRTVGLTKAHGALMALRGVDLEVPRGDLVEECPDGHDARWERGLGRQKRALPCPSDHSCWLAGHASAR